MRQAAIGIVCVWVAFLAFCLCAIVVMTFKDYGPWFGVGAILFIAFALTAMIAGESLND